MKPPSAVFRLVFVLASMLRAAPAAGLDFSVASSHAELRECSADEVEISFSIRSQSPVEVGGFQAFLRYPAQYFEPVRYAKRDLQGFAAVNGPAPFGSGFLGCDEPPADPWDDGIGEDVVSVVATAFAEGGTTEPLLATSAILGSFVFRLKAGVAPPAEPVRFSLEFESCSRIFLRGNLVFDTTGRVHELGFSTPSISVGLPRAKRVNNLACTKEAEGSAAVLSWTLAEGPGVDGVNLYRNGVAVRRFIPPGPQTVRDESAPRALLRYKAVAVVAGAEEVCREECSLDLRGISLPFTRGNGNGDDKVNLSDAISLLGYLFLGQTDAVDCPDGADFDDSGILELTDSIALLDFLFRGGTPPSPPYPGVGEDPTPGDPLGCG